MGLLSWWTGRGKAGQRPLIQISESHQVTEESGYGVRDCHKCETRWRSVLGQLIDAGELAKLAARGECRVYASWEETIGLTCRECGRSLCMAHVGEPASTGDVPQPRDYRCPFCGGRMDNA